MIDVIVKENESIHYFKTGQSCSAEYKKSVFSFADIAIGL
jgi:hypothetical protein